VSKAAVDDLAAVPPQNAEIYGRLFEIENALRELIVESMSAVAGPRWYHHRLPHESRVNVEQGLARDHQTRWTQNVIHHPMYYVDFSDLRLTIEQRDNWSDAFRQVFSKNKELVTTDLSELEFIRNKVAHNRRASTVDVDVVRAAHAKLTSVLGNRLEALSQRYSIVSSAATYLGQLKREGEVAYTLCSRGRRIKNLGTWELAASTWWCSAPGRSGSASAWSPANAAPKCW